MQESQVLLQLMVTSLKGHCSDDRS